MKKLSLVALFLSLSTGSSFALAETESGQSQSYIDGVVDIRIDKTESTRGPHGGAVDDPGIGYRGTHNGTTISLSGLKGMRGVVEKPGDVYVLDSTATPVNVPNHGSMGKFQFSQVADAEVYYGDWSQTGIDGDTTHTAYFSGKNATTAVPTSGQATYTLEGINQFDGEAKLTGTFDANFEDKSYVGSLQGELLAISLDGSIEGHGAFSGSAMANQSVEGVNSGQFFGDNAEQVAGITTFKDNHHLDTSFGGSKN